MNADFIPVALKAGLVNNPPNNDEGRLYAEIGRSKPAPQGICVVNSAGKVLAWALMFDDDNSVPVFLDHTMKRFREYPGAKNAVAAERYMRFPSTKLDDTQDNGKVLPIPESHAKGKGCPAKPPIGEGTVTAKVFGRALDKDGKPMADTVRQEHYVEDRFNIPLGMQEGLAKALAEAGGNRFQIPDGLAGLLVSHAYLGQLDVNPFGGQPGSDKPGRRQQEFWGQAIEGKTTRIRIDGKSSVAGVSAPGQGGDGRFWDHDVQLTWEGLIEMHPGGITKLHLLADGSEKLRWGNKQFPGGEDITHLPAGHAIDLTCRVRYGIVGEPAPAPEEASATPAADDQEIPEPARRQLAQALGPPFLLFREKAQEELKLSDEQKKKLAKRLQETVSDAMQFFQKLGDKKPDEQEKETQAYRQKVGEKLAAFLKETLKEDQRRRLRQLELQQEGAFVLGRPDIGKELMITDEQRNQFMAVVQELPKKIEPLIKEAQSGGNPQEIGTKIMKIRKEHESRIEAILTDAQKQQWKEMRGKPLDLGD